MHEVAQEALVANFDLPDSAGLGMENLTRAVPVLSPSTAIICCNYDSSITGADDTNGLRRPRPFCRLAMLLTRSDRTTSSCSPP